MNVSLVKNTYNNELLVAFAGEEFPFDEEFVNFKLYNDDYTVEINGIEYKARDCRVSAMPFNTLWPGHQRDFAQSESAAFISIYSSESVTLRVRYKKGFDNPVIRPASKGVKVKMDGDVAEFTLIEHKGYVLESAGEHHALHIFFEEPKNYDAEKATYYFGEGIHFPGTVTLRDNDSVYIDKNAVVFGSLYSEGAENIRIYGGGTIDNTTEERVVENCYEPYAKGTLRLYNCKNVSIEDIILTNSCTWILALFDCDSVNIDNVKLVGHWRYNTDGIDITNTSNVNIKNCFIRSFDDTITIKAIYNYPHPIENIHVENCVMWCGWGMNCEIGVESDAPEYRNITFKKCDLIRSAGNAIDIQNGRDCLMHGITFEEINVEIQNDCMCPMLQKSADQKYDPPVKTALPNLISIVNRKYPIRQKTLGVVTRVECDEFGRVSDILYKNINVYLDDGIEQKPMIKFVSCDANRPFENIVIDGLYVNGEKQTNLDLFNVKIENCNPVTLK